MILPFTEEVVSFVQRLVPIDGDQANKIAEELRLRWQHFVVIEKAKEIFGPTLYRVIVETYAEYDDSCGYDYPITAMLGYDIHGTPISTWYPDGEIEDDYCFRRYTIRYEDDTTFDVDKPPQQTFQQVYGLLKK